MVRLQRRGGLVSRFSRIARPTAARVGSPRAISRPAAARRGSARPPRPGPARPGRSRSSRVQLGDLGVVGGVLGQLRRAASPRAAPAWRPAAPAGPVPCGPPARSRRRQPAAVRRVGAGRRRLAADARSGPDRGDSAAGRRSTRARYSSTPPGRWTQPAVAEHAVHRVGDPLDQVAVVAGDDHRARPGVEQVLQRRPACRCPGRWWARRAAARWARRPAAAAAAAAAARRRTGRRPASTGACR